MRGAGSSPFTGTVLQGPPRVGSAAAAHGILVSGLSSHRALAVGSHGHVPGFDNTCLFSWHALPLADTWAENNNKDGNTCKITHQDQGKHWGGDGDVSWGRETRKGEARCGGGGKRQGWIWGQAQHVHANTYKQTQTFTCLC